MDSRLLDSAIAIACMILLLAGPALIRRLVDRSESRTEESPKLIIEEEALDERTAWRSRPTITSGRLDGMDRPLGHGHR